ncbi:Tad domain-containing protein [Pseudomonas sp. N040]|uniref:Tad domain-containing protein n=1 Tax=Pseudomonas sp. N040 TaxID=2785325 RepID=UPI0018A32760|nr:Tad domain-containing protein [Pseudomonas sp. N040]MBF7728648.1 Tad domain-containing protein [Pseudomonas sp. N040]MBW7012288.1 Tad domain-containing protein [Pseudomonas sp. N040]
MNPCKQWPSYTAPERQRGAVIVLVTLAMVAMLLMAALALDGGHMLVNKTRLQNSVDAAALSGAKTLQQVLGSSNAAIVSRSAALATLTLNANASGNSELATAVTAAGGAGAFAVVELANSVYGPFSFPGPANASYVRVSVPNYPLSGFFWNFAQAFAGGGLGAKAVAAIATAGPSPTSPCDLAPLMVCGDTTQHDPDTGLFWGYQLGELEVLKSAKNNTSGIGPGNFQLLDFGSGGQTVREALAGGGTLCPAAGENVGTKPGNTVGPSAQGFNTRFGQYVGPMGGTESIYPPDLVTTFNQLGNGNGALTVDLTDDSVSYLGTGGGLVHSDSAGNILTASGTGLFDLNDWKAASADCVANPSASGCQSDGVFERRMLKIVIGQCSGTDGGTASVPVLGFACFFALQPMDQTGGQAWLLGQFSSVCEGDDFPGPNPVEDAGPQIIQLYKTYIDNSQTPSTDS